MLISASRRTDIPAYFSEWFLKRIQEKFVLVRNPMNSRQISQISLSPDVVDGIVFWTKNAAPMIDKLAFLSDYMYYFQFTLTPYGRDIEPGVPSKDDVIIPTFQRLADRLGPDRLIWRYDPILLNEKYTLDYHIDNFDKMARRLQSYTKKCTISFIDDYRHAQKPMKDLNLTSLTDDHVCVLAQNISKIARGYGLLLDTCAERTDLSQYGISHGRCVDGLLFEKLLGYRLDIEQDKSQRPTCNCSASIDIGAYNTCPNGCGYCYANTRPTSVIQNVEKYNPAAPLLCDCISEDEKPTVRSVRTNRIDQMDLFRDV